MAVFLKLPLTSGCLVQISIKLIKNNSSGGSWSATVWSNHVLNGQVLIRQLFINILRDQGYILSNTSWSEQFLIKAMVDPTVCNQTMFDQTLIDQTTNCKSISMHFTSKVALELQTQRPIKICKTCNVTDFTDVKSVKAVTWPTNLVWQILQIQNQHCIKKMWLLFGGRIESPLEKVSGLHVIRKSDCYLVVGLIVPLNIVWRLHGIQKCDCFYFW